MPPPKADLTGVGFDRLTENPEFHMHYSNLNGSGEGSTIGCEVNNSSRRYRIADIKNNTNNSNGGSSRKGLQGFAGYDSDDDSGVYDTAEPSLFSKTGILHP
jgi:hypothetical protein